MKKAFAAAVGVAVFIAVWSSIYQNLAPEVRRHEQLARLGMRVTGDVTAKEPMNHASIRYDYFVDGVRYAGGSCSLPTQFDSYSRRRFRLGYLRS